jgi:nicotinate-nucleotide pyrophosphorylase (carboxylating)
MFESNESLDEALNRNVRDALAEDVGRGDWSARAWSPRTGWRKRT